MTRAASWERAVGEIDEGFAELVEFTRALVRVPSVNPPGQDYAPCAELIGGLLTRWGYEVDFPEAPGGERPRPNVIGVRDLGRPGPTLHLNGHFDVVPPGEGWTVNPFDADVKDGRIYGRGTCDMKAGLACAMFAAEAVRRAGVPLAGKIEVSGTVDEESGGFAGVGHLVDTGRISARSVDYAIIPEPFGPKQVCIGHRGVLWSKVRSTGRIAHGSMPHLGRSAIDDLNRALEVIRTELAPVLAARRTAMPVVPDACRHGSLNVNGIAGGQGTGAGQTPCVADVAEAVFDRRFLLEESVDDVRAEIKNLLGRLSDADPGLRFDIEELMLVPPVQAPTGSPLVRSLENGISEVFGDPGVRVASPGTYDQKHFARGGVTHCVAYGPGRLELAHQPDEWVALEDMRAATRVMAWAITELLSP